MNALRKLQENYCEIRANSKLSCLFNAVCKHCENDVIIMHDSNDEQYENALRMSNAKLKDLFNNNTLVEAHEITKIDGKLSIIYPHSETLYDYRVRYLVPICNIRKLIYKIMEKLLILGASNLAFIKLEPFNITFDKFQNVKLMGLMNIVNIESRYENCQNKTKYQNDHEECEYYSRQNMSINLGRLAYFLATGNIASNIPRMSEIHHEGLKDFIWDLLHPNVAEDFFKIITHQFMLNSEL